MTDSCMFKLDPQLLPTKVNCKCIKHKRKKNPRSWSSNKDPHLDNNNNGMKELTVFGLK